MFEATLEQKFKDIFVLKKVTFNSPGEKHEQGCLFIEIEDPGKVVITDNRARTMVTGKAFMFSKSSILPFGFFGKMIHKAAPALTKDLYFYEMDRNKPMYQNLVQRGFSFIYFFDCEHDPNDGSITSVTVDTEFTEE